MTFRLPLPGNKHVAMHYAHTMANPNEVKDKLYDDLVASSRTVKLILLDELNAIVGTDHQTYEGVIGSQGIGK